MGIPGNNRSKII